MRTSRIYIYILHAHITVMVITVWGMVPDVVDWPSSL